MKEMFKEVGAVLLWIAKKLVWVVALGVIIVLGYLGWAWIAGWFAANAQLVAPFMTGPAKLCLAGVIAGLIILQVCHDYVPAGEPGKSRIIRVFGREIGMVCGPGPLLVIGRGFIMDFTEVQTRFDIEVPEFKFDCPGDHIPLIAAPTLTVEIHPRGGKEFNLAGGFEGASRKIARMVRTEIQEFAANPDNEPQKYEMAKKMITEFVLYAVARLVEEDLIKKAADEGRGRGRFVAELERELSEGDTRFTMPQFGLVLVGFNMGNFTEPKMITDAEAAKVAAAREAEMKLANVKALKERVDALTAGHANVSFKDATMAVQIQEGTIKHNINEDIVRIVSDGSGDGIGTLIGGLIAAARAKQPKGGRDGGGKEKP